MANVEVTVEELLAEIGALHIERQKLEQQNRRLSADLVKALSDNGSLRAELDVYQAAEKADLAEAARR